MPPAFILSQDQTLHLILTQTHLRLFISWNDILKYIKCFCSESTLYILSNSNCLSLSFQRAICSWPATRSKSLFTIPLRIWIVNSKFNFFYFLSISSFVLACSHWLAARWVLDYSTTYPPPLQVYFWIFLEYFSRCFTYRIFSHCFFRIQFISGYFKSTLNYLYSSLISMF